MNLSINDVKKIAELARIELNSGEQERLAQTISVVLDYMTVLNEVNTDGVEPTYHVTGLHDVTRPDVAIADKNRAALVAAFPEKLGAELSVPGVFDSE